VNDVLDLSKVEAGKQDFFPERVDAGQAIEEAVSMLAPLANHRGVVLDARAPSGTYVHADPLRLRQILYNLISNAVKFTDRDRRVSVSAADEGACVAIAVADQGVGIAEADQALLFRAFEQIALPDGERPPGTGLGLALAKRLVDLHGGTIELVSQRGVGTTFTVRIPTSSMELL
jgi:signal transduction histidine kinase